MRECYRRRHHPERACGSGCIEHTTESLEQRHSTGAGRRAGKACFLDQVRSNAAIYDAEQPDELQDLGDDARFELERLRLHELLFLWARQPRHRATIDFASVICSSDRIPGNKIVGIHDQSECHL